MDFYNQFARSLKGQRRLVMFLIIIGLGYIEYHLISYFIKVFNLYLSNNHTESLTFVIVLGIIVLIILITVILYQWPIALVFMFKETMKSKEEAGLRLTLEKFFTIGILIFFICFIIMEIYIFLSLLFKQTPGLLWEVPFSVYAIFLLYAIVKGIKKEFTVL